MRYSSAASSGRNAARSISLIARFSNRSHANATWSSGGARKFSKRLQNLSLVAHQMGFSPRARDKCLRLTLSEPRGIHGLAKRVSAEADLLHCFPQRSTKMLKRAVLGEEWQH